MLAKRIKKHFALYTMLIPCILFFLIFCYLPMAGLMLAFKDYQFNKGILGSPWVGLTYFKNFFSSYDSMRLVVNTLKVGFLKCFIEFPFPIILAVMINEVKNQKIKNLVQTVSYMPHFLSWVIVITMVQRMLAPENGLLNQLLMKFGSDGKTFFMMDAKYFYRILFGTDLWKSIGWGSIMYLAAISAIDPTLYEAAEIDGCGRLRKIWSITIPSIMTTIGVLFILGVGGIISSGFDQIYLLRTPGNMQIADTLDVYVVRIGLTGGQFGYASAVGMIQGIVGFILVLVTNKLSKKFTEVSIW